MLNKDIAGVIVGPLTLYQVVQLAAVVQFHCAPTDCPTCEPSIDESYTERRIADLSGRLESALNMVERCRSNLLDALGYSDNTEICDVLDVFDTAANYIRMNRAHKYPEVPNVDPFEESASEQIERLSEFIIAEVEGEPSKSEGAVDCAIRLLRQAFVNPTALARSKARTGKLIADLAESIEGATGRKIYGLDDILKAAADLIKNKLR